MMNTFQENNSDLVEWISSIIDSCNNQFHFDAVDKLIELYFEREKNEDMKLELQIKKQQKWNDIHNILT